MICKFKDGWSMFHKLELRHRLFGSNYICQNCYHVMSKSEGEVYKKLINKVMEKQIEYLKYYIHLTPDTAKPRWH